MWAACVLFLLFTGTASAGSISLGWAPSASPTAVGYVVLYGPSSGVYTNAVNVGNQTSVTIRGLADQVVYYFVVEAYSSDGTLSLFSNEVSTSTTNTPPQVVNPGPQASAAGATVNLPIVAVDSESDPLSFSAKGLPISVFIDPVTGIITGSVDPTDTRPHLATISVSDGPTISKVVFTWNAPTIASVTPSIGPPGTVVTITGTNFGATQGTSKVTFNGVAATPTSWSDTSIVVPAPAGGSPGSVVVNVAGVDSLGQPFTSGPLVSASASVINPASAITVSWSGISTPSSTDWIGVFAYGAPSTAPVLWFYTGGGASGTHDLTLPTSLPSGRYELRLFSQGGLDVLDTSPAIDVGSATISGGPSSVGPGGTVTAAWAGIRLASPNDWIAFVKVGQADNGYVAWVSTASATGSGSTGLIVPRSTPPGTYQLRLFAANSTRRLAVSNTITVDASTLAAGPAVVGPGGTVTASWSGIGAPTANDWLMIVPTGGVDASYVAWAYTNGTSAGSKVLTVPKTAAPGTYEVRLFANNSFLRLAVSNTFVVPAVSLTASPSTLAPGGTLTVAWKYMGVTSSTDWFALVPVGAADTSWMAFIYGTGRANDSTLFNIPANLAAGTYEVRLFSNNTFKRVTVSNSITVTASGPTLATSPVSTAAGGTLTASWRNIAAPTPTDWVGLYTVGSTDASFVTKTYTNGRATDRMLMTLPGNVATGSYELRLFSSDSLTLLATSNGFEVTTDARVSASPLTVNAGATLNVAWSGIATPTATDWVGLVPLNGADSAYLAWHFTNGAASGALNLSIPSTVPTGTYEVRLFAQNSFQRLAVANLINVGPSLSANPTPAAPGGTLTVTWSGIVNPAAHDWIALVPLNAADNHWVAWEYTDGTATGSKTFNIPANLPAALYDVRLFPNDTVTRIASSDNVITIAPGPSLSVRNASLTTTYHSGDMIQTSWSGIAAPSLTDWIGLYPAGAADSAYVYQTNTSGLATGSTSIIVPAGLTPGQYELRLFSNGTQTRLTVSNSLQIQ
jgi:IPT/TIG domain-containing protein/fibronectin type III domain protein